MTKRALPFLLAALAAASCKSSAPDWGHTLPEGAPALLPLGPDEPYPDVAAQWDARDEILPALERSLAWMRRRHAQQFFPRAGISYERALASLERFEEVLSASAGPEDFQRRMEQGFTVYRAAGWDGDGGGVLFTAYCTPILQGSATPSERYRYPLYALPPDLVKEPDGTVRGWDTAFGLLPSYPSRGAIEASGMLADRGLELVWLAGPIDAYLAHVNGSAFLEMPDGTLLRLGYAGKNGRPYTSLGRELEDEGVLPRGSANLRRIREWAASAPPEEVAEYLSRNASFVFFTPISGNPHGSLDVEVTSGRSVATDKTLFPRAALVWVEAEVPASIDGAPEPFRRFLFDQDTGGAIRSAGRADLYLGIGREAEGRAGRTRSEGQLYYFFAKE